MENGRRTHNNMKKKRKTLIFSLISTAIAVLIMCRLFVAKIGTRYYFTHTENAKVSFGTTELTEKDYDSLKRLKKLKELFLSDTPIKNTEFLESMPEIEKLHLATISDIDRENICLSDLSACRKLSDIYLHLAGIDSLSYFSDMPELRSLYLVGAGKCVSFKDLKNSDSLETIRLEGLNIKDLNGIENVKNLKSLDILYILQSDTDIVSDCMCRLDPLKELSGLERLILSDYPYPIDVSNLDKCACLKYVNLKDCELLNADAQIFASMPALEELQIEGVKINNIGDLAQSSSLKRITVSGGMYSADEMLPFTLAGIKVNYE